VLNRVVLQRLGKKHPCTSRSYRVIPALLL